MGRFKGKILTPGIQLNAAKKFYFAIILIFLIIVIGVAGYSILEGWNILDSVYMTAITLTTIGFGEVYPLSPEGKVFTLALIFLGVGTLAFAVTSGTRMILEGELQLFIGRRKMEKKLKSLKDHYILCGYGRMGSLVCNELSKNGTPFVVIEEDIQVVDRVLEKGFYAIHGDATEDETLLKAGINHAKGIICLVSTDAKNVFIVLTARVLNRNIFIISRALEDGSEEKLRRAGANKVLSPYSIGGKAIANVILKPNIVDFLELAVADESMELQIEDIRIGKGSRYNGVLMKDSGIRQELGVIIVAVKKNDGSMKYNPPSDYVFAVGDRLIALGEPEMLKKLEALSDV